MKLTSRERWLKTMRFQGVDYVSDMEFGYWNETLKRWHKEGLPEDMNNNWDAEAYFGLEQRRVAPIKVGLLPGFEDKVIEETDKYKIIINGEGAKCQINKDGSSSIPHYLEFALKDRKSWQEFKKRLEPNASGRYPENWEELKKEWENRDYPLEIGVGGLFGCIRNWMGFENSTMAFYDQPDLIEEIMEHMTQFIMTVIEKALKEVQFDGASFWEDMAFNKGPMISPAMFKKYMVPRYKRITDLLRKHGIDIIIVDCDGNINELASLWLEAGINCMFPCEMNGNSDPVKLREKYGRDILLLGGVDKTKLSKGRGEIDKELKRLAKTIEGGGFAPHVDHRCPPNVSLEDYRYYLETKRKLLGMK